MNAADYFLAAIPEPFQILGLRLNPFCLGHYFLMRRFDCAFVNEESVNATIEDLVFGVLICSMTYEEFIEFLASENFLSEVKQWGAQFRLDFSFTEKVKLFNEYLSKAFKQPSVVFEGDETNSGAHWSQTVKCALIAHCGYNESQAMNLPLSQAFHDFYKNAESNGVLRIVDDEEVALLNASPDELKAEIERHFAAARKEATCP
jgi:hypothetical protein